MIAITRTLSAVLLATVVSLAATPSYAWTDGTVHMSAARAAALRECNARAEPYIQRDWGVTQLQIYRSCMAEHHQPE
jgi:Tfp pilus assembly protein PilE